MIVIFRSLLDRLLLINLRQFRFIEKTAQIIERKSIYPFIVGRTCETTCVYVSAIIADLQHWRRAELDNNKSAFHWATFIFGCLMALIGVLGCFDIPLEVRLFCIIPILGLATSTIDSIAVAMHECVNKWVGTTLAMLIICFWWILLDSNAIQVWNYHGVVRCVDALMIVGLSAYWWYKHTRYKLV